MYQHILIFNISRAITRAERQVSSDASDRLRLLQAGARLGVFRRMENGGTVNRIKGIRAIAEFAADFDAAALGEDAADLRFAQGPQDARDPLARTTTLKVDRNGGIEPHVVLGKQALQELALGEGQQLRCRQSGCQVTDAIPELVNLLERGQAALVRRQALQQKTRCAIRAGREPDTSRQLLGRLEIGFERTRKTVSGEWHDPLIARRLVIRFQADAETAVAGQPLQEVGGAKPGGQVAISGDS